MPTPGAFALSAAAALDIVLPGARALSDYRQDLERIEPGEDRWQFAVGPAGVFGDSNVVYGVVECRVRHHHRIVGQDERAWTEGGMLTLLDAIVRPSYWRGLAGVHDVQSPPEYTVARTGPVVSAEITVTVSLGPA
ncbi:MAG: hypothetical protein ACREI7_14220 [Myxococcota bacterium]